ncbi:MAG: SGNH/GDSL hydrolase family protein [Gammaproteobacteria bacterium]|nr:SGNH/GDSL hydrolase family protein [Gammaproteobacteria bacterium]
MRQILVYADSLSWGIMPGSRNRFAFDKRWPGVLETQLNSLGHRVRIIEDCLNGRRTVWEDPFKAGRNGNLAIAQSIEMHSPLELIIIMLGTNDFQSMHTNNAWHSAQGLKTVIQSARHAPIEPGMPQPPILIVTPPLIEKPMGPIAPKFEGAENKCLGLVEQYKTVAEEQDCYVFDSNRITTASKVDGIHLDADQHLALGHALLDTVQSIITGRSQIFAFN